MTNESSDVSKRVAGIEPQRIRTLFDLAAEHDAEDLVHLEIGEPDFDTPAHVVTAACEAARDGQTRYTDNAGIRPLREAIATSLERDAGLTVDPGEEVVVTTGGVEAHHLAIHALADPGDEVVVPTPAWPNTVIQTELANAVPRQVPLSPEAGFALDPDRVSDEISDDTAVVVLTSPSNPTGRVWDVEDMEAIVATAADHDAVVIADEVYQRLCYDGPNPSLAATTEYPERVLTVGSVSKAYAMTGWRVGWLTGPPAVLDQVRKIHEGTTSCVATPCQHAAIAALTGPQEPVETMVATFEERRDFVADRLAEIPRIACPDPEGAFYAFVDVNALEGSSMAIAKRLLYDYDVVTAPGDAFGPGGEGYLRLSFANSRDRLAAGLDRIEQLVRDER